MLPGPGLGVLDRVVGAKDRVGARAMCVRVCMRAGRCMRGRGLEGWVPSGRRARDAMRGREGWGGFASAERLSQTRFTVGF